MLYPSAPCYSDWLFDFDLDNEYLHFDGYMSVAELKFSKLCAVEMRMELQGDTEDDRPAAAEISQSREQESISHRPEFIDSP